MSLRLRLALEWIVIGILASGLVCAVHFWHAADSFDNLLYDQISAVKRPVADKNILIVAIDDPSLAVLGKWPWSRDVHAKLLRKLQSLGVRSITLDILLSERSGAQDDYALAQAMAGPTPVIIPLHFVSPGSNGKAYDIFQPLPEFTRVAYGVGHVNVEFDYDGIVRRAALCFDPEKNGKHWPHLMEQTYRSSVGKPAHSRAYTRTACGGTVLIPYARRDSFAVISYDDILNGAVPEQLLKGRDIIIGATAAGLGDNFPAPFGDGGLLPGVEIMANMLSTLRSDSFIRPMLGSTTVMLSVLPLWLLLIGFLRWRPRTALLSSIAAVLLILVTSVAALTLGIWFAPGGALLGILLVYPLWGWRRLQAMSDFLVSELGALERDGEKLSLPIRPSRATDMVGRQSEALAVAIDQMRDLRRFISDALADLPDPMFVTDPDGAVTLTNDLLDHQIGRNVTGLNLHDVLDAIVKPEQRNSVDQYLDHAGAVHARDFIRFTSPQERTFVLRRAPVLSDTGALRGYIHYLADITALANAETEREQVLQLLSHDMRAPQSAIIALLDGKIDADARKRIERNARRTMQLAQDFVDLARMGETQFDGEDVLITDLARDVADNFWPLSKERGIKITVKDDSDDAFISAEPDSLSRAFANLIDNAIKFSPDAGHILIRVYRAEPAKIIIEISDQGGGIHPEILPRLFNRFVTADEHSGRVKGTGIGLTFVKAVVERHAGEISVHNIDNSGACFRIELPMALDMIDGLD